MRSKVPVTPPTANLAALQAASERLVADLERGFRGQVERALGAPLDGSVTSLAYVDYHLAQARDEPREPILTLLAAGAGAYFGELIRREFGGHWLGDGERATHLRLLLAPQMIFFSPFACALEAILGESVPPGDPRAPEQAPVDATFHFARPPRATPTPEGWDGETADEDDAGWLTEVLASHAPVATDHYFSLTCRFETLSLMIELLASRQAGRGSAPRAYTIADYLAAFNHDADPPAAGDDP